MAKDENLIGVGLIALFLWWLLHRNTSTGVVLVWTDPNTGIQYPVDQTCTDAQGVTHPAGECTPVDVPPVDGGGDFTSDVYITPIEYWSGAGDAPPPDWWLT